MRRLASALAMVAALSMSAPVLADDHMTTGSQLYQIDLETGDLMPIGMIGTDQTVIGFALDVTAATPETARAVTTDNTVLTFDVNSPEMLAVEVPLMGIAEGDWLVGIDHRPATGELFGISAMDVMYSIVPGTGEAFPVGDGIDPTLEADSIGFDFNPTVDRIRVDVTTTQNLRLNPETGMVGTNPDTGQPTNDGVLNTVAPLTEMVNAYTSFDIAPSGEAFLVIPAWDMDMATPEM
jgi:hypothetical protein